LLLTFLLLLASNNNPVAYAVATDSAVADVLLLPVAFLGSQLLLWSLLLLASLQLLASLLLLFLLLLTSQKSLLHAIASLVCPTL
jgi:hypothetical protein